MMQALLWKEWREQNWKMLFGCVMVLGCTAVGLRARMVPDGAILGGGLFLAAIVLPLLSAMGVVGTDRAEGSLRHLLALPIAPWRVLALKLSIAALTCLAPLVVAGIAVTVMAAGRELTLQWIWGAVGLGIWIALCLLIWTVALGIGQPTEARVGLVGIAIFTGWFCVLQMVSMWSITRGTWLLYELVPLGMGYWVGHEHEIDWSTVALGGAFELACLVALWFWATRRLAKLGGQDNA